MGQCLSSLFHNGLGVMVWQRNYLRLWNMGWQYCLLLLLNNMCLIGTTIYHRTCLDIAMASKQTSIFFGTWYWQVTFQDNFLNPLVKRFDEDDDPIVFAKQLIEKVTLIAWMHGVVIENMG